MSGFVLEVNHPYYRVGWVVTNDLAMAKKHLGHGVRTTVRRSDDIVREMSDIAEKHACLYSRTFGSSIMMAYSTHNKLSMPAGSGQSLDLWDVNEYLYENRHELSRYTSENIRRHVRAHYHASNDVTNNVEVLTYKLPDGWAFYYYHPYSSLAFPSTEMANAYMDRNKGIVSYLPEDIIRRIYRLLRFKDGLCLDATPEYSLGTTITGTWEYTKREVSFVLDHIPDGMCVYIPDPDDRDYFRKTLHNNNLDIYTGDDHLRDI